MSPLYVEYEGYEIDFGMMATETSFDVWDSISYRIPSTSKVTALQITDTNVNRRKRTRFIATIYLSILLAMSLNLMALSKYQAKAAGHCS